MEKSAEAFRTISEVSDLLDTPAHVLRFWESRFAQVKPVKRAGGRRYYRPSDVALLGGIRKLLHDDGMTIRGVQKILREQGVRHVAALASDWNLPAAPAPASNGRWPAAAPPDAAGEGDRLLHDPEDAAGEEAGEAPMHVDVPTLPLGHPDNVLPIQTATVGPNARPEALPEAPPEAPAGARRAATDTARPPAAAMLRAMDALRAHDKNSELRVVYTRLSALRDRLAQRNDPASR